MVEVVLLDFYFRSHKIGRHTDRQADITSETIRSSKMGYHMYSLFIETATYCCANVSFNYLVAP